jgi:hypothetical protein
MAAAVSDAVISTATLIIASAFAVVMVAVAAAAVAAILLRVAIRRGVTSLGDLFRKKKPLPAITVLGSGHGQHQTAFVSRHHLAEGGVTCPICQTVIASGDFSGVKEYMVDGRANEGIVCQGEREVGDRVVACAMILLASPDTEHGDHLDGAGKVDAKGVDPPEYYTFVRASPLQALREKWGVNVADADSQSGTVDLKEAAPAGAAAAPAASPAPAGAVSPAHADTAILPAVKG